MRPLVFIVLLVDALIICLALILYYEFGVGQLPPCQTDMECEAQHGVDE